MGRFAYSCFDGGMPWTIPNLLLHDKPVPLANMRSHGRTECSPVAAIRAVITTTNWTSAVFRMTWPSHVCSAQSAIIAAPKSARHGCCIMA